MEKEEEKKWEKEAKEKVKKKKTDKQSSSLAAVCEKLKHGKCPHGKTGKKKVNGVTCNNAHPLNRCFRYCSFGPKDRKGCPRGLNCFYFHPMLCMSSVRHRKCFNENCTYVHLKGTFRKKETAIPQQKNTRPVPSKVPQKKQAKKTGAKQPVAPRPPDSFFRVDRAGEGDAVPVQTGDCINQVQPVWLTNPRLQPTPAERVGMYSSLILLNIQSMNPGASSSVRWKVLDLASFKEIERSKKHILPFIAITETWLKSYFSDAQLQIPDYVVSRCDRDKRVGGGVLLYSHVNIPVCESSTFDDGICQGLFCKFDTVKMCIAVVYRPPDAPCSSFKGVIDFMKQEVSNINDDSYQYCFTGDFNLPNIDWTALGASGGMAQSADVLIKFMSEGLLNQYISIPTRGENILDLFFTNDNCLVTNVSVADTDMSDHRIVDIMFSSNPVCPDTVQMKTYNANSFRSLDFNKADYEVLNKKLSVVDWSALRQSCSFEEFPHHFTDTLLKLCQSIVPARKVPSGRPKVLNALRRKKNRLKAKLSAVSLSRRPSNSERIQNLQDQVSLVCFEIKESVKRSNEQRELNAIQKIKSNPKFFYSYAKSFSKVKSTISMLFNQDGEVKTDKEKIADVLQDQFSSVFSDPNSPHIKDPNFELPNISRPFSEEDLSVSCEDIIAAIKDIDPDSACGPDGVPAVLLKHCSQSLSVPIRLLWDESIRTGIVPGFYKRTFIAPLYKLKGNRAQAVNYRPIALTSHVIKIYERVLRKLMVSFIDDNNILCPDQHGFRSGRSCLTQMLSHFDEVMQGLTDNADTDAIYLDYAKAFDKVDHRLLLAKLLRYGLSKKVVDWINSFLTNRLQTVVVEGSHSRSVVTLSGVPQGTVLGPILFILFINDMKNCVQHSKVSFFADDTRISKQIRTSTDVSLLQEDLNNVTLWAKQNNMKLHEDKFELLVHKSNPNFVFNQLPFALDHMSYQISSGETLYPADSLRDLGVQVTSELSWSKHVSNITRKGRSVASWVFSVFKTRNTETMLTLYKSLVRSHLEYCCPLWNPSKIIDIQLLEGVQRTVTNKIWGVQHLDYWDRLKALNLMSLQRRRERYIIIQMWKVLNHLTPNDLAIEFILPRYRKGIQAKVPDLCRGSLKRNQSLYDSSFAVLGPRLWNSIPCNLTSIATFPKFKHQLTAFLLTIPDKPPVMGYSCVNGNSILEWKQT